MSKMIIYIFGIIISLVPGACFGQSTKMRNPFFILKKEKFEDKKGFIYSNREKLITLAGVIESDSGWGAILTKGLKKEVVFLNDMIWGYQVKQVAMNHVVLLKDGEEIKVFIS